MLLQRPRPLQHGLERGIASCGRRGSSGARRQRAPLPPLCAAGAGAPGLPPQPAQAAWGREPQQHDGSRASSRSEDDHSAHQQQQQQRQPMPPLPPPPPPVLHQHPSSLHRMVACLGTAVAVALGMLLTLLWPAKMVAAALQHQHAVRPTVAVSSAGSLLRPSGRRPQAGAQQAFASVGIGGTSRVFKSERAFDVATFKLAGLLQQVLSAHIALKVSRPSPRAGSRFIGRCLFPTCSGRLPQRT